MKFIHAADIHLGSPLGGLDGYDDAPADRIREAPFEAFENLAALCQGEEADLLVIAGDLFDGDAPHPARTAAIRTLARIAGGGTRVVMISGNHDAESKMQRRLPEMEYVWQLSASEPETVTFEEIGVCVHGRGFDTPKLLDNIVTGYPAATGGMFNIGLLHTSLGSPRGHDPYAPCDKDDLIAKGYDYWALGHIHIRSVENEDPWIIYSGNLQGRDPGETGNKGATVVEVENRVIVGEPKHVDLDVVRWHNIDVPLDEAVGADDLATAAVEAVEQAIAGASDRDHVVRLEFVGRTRAHTDIDREPAAWREAIQEGVLSSLGDQVWIQQIEFSTRPVIQHEVLTLERDDFIGNLARSFEHGGGETDIVSAVLEKKLRALGATGERLVASSGDDDISRAQESLLARLSEAEQSATEAAR